ncbi:MAG: ComF family protein [Pseudomonadota bacterium]
MRANLWNRLTDLVYPPQCIACPNETDLPDGLCPACWREVQFITGPVCRFCAHPVAAEGLACSDCHRTPPPWDDGHAATIYDGIARRIVLSLKHGDRTDLSGIAARWLARAAGPSLDTVDVIAPIPLHWTRLVRRRYNQSAELARALSTLSGRAVVPDLLSRSRATRSLKGLSREQRQQVLSDCIVATPARRDRIAGRHVLLVDDVLTSGATLSAATLALRAAGAQRVTILVLARVVRSEIPWQPQPIEASTDRADHPAVTDVAPQQASSI